MLKIPFSLLPQKKLFKISKPFRGFSQLISKRVPFLEVHLKQAESKLSSIEYISMCLFSTILMFFFFFAVSLPAKKFGAPIAACFFIALIITIFVFLQQLAYPGMIANRRVKLIERNLFYNNAEMAFYFTKENA